MSRKIHWERGRTGIEPVLWVIEKGDTRGQLQRRGDGRFLYVDLEARPLVRQELPVDNEFDAQRYVEAMLMLES